PFAALVARIQGEWHQWRRWWLALWLVLVTHPLLDAMTVYGTQLALPWSDRPYGVGSIFIIDPLYTLPLLAGVFAVLVARGSRRGHVLNAAGLQLSCALPARGDDPPQYCRCPPAAGPARCSRRVHVLNAAVLLLSCAYLAWGVAAQQHVERLARAELARQGIEAQRLLVTPTAFNTVLWRIVAMEAGGDYHEAYRSLLDEGPGIAFRRFDGGAALATELMTIDGVRRIAAFSRGFYKLGERDGSLRVTDLRMGYEPYYTFNFVVAERRSAMRVLPTSRHESERGDVRELLDWTWRRV